MPVTAFDDAALQMGLFGDGVVLQVGKQCCYEVIDNNTVRVYDGVYMLQGHQIEISPNEHHDFTIENGTSGTVRYDLIGFTYSETDGLVHTVLKNAGTIIPEQEDLWSGAESASGYLYRVKLNGLNIESVEQLFRVVRPISETAQLVYPVGAIYQSVLPTDPEELFGGVWEPFGTGRVLFGYDASQTEFNEAKKTGGAKCVDLKHQHLESIGTDANNFFVDNDGSYSSHGSITAARRGFAWANSNTTVDLIRLSKTSNELSDETNILPPYQVCYRWVRTA